MDERPDLDMISDGPAEPSSEIISLRRQLAEAHQMIAALVDAAERRPAAVRRLSDQHVVERRATHAYQAERVLRSVIEALEGALCIVGADGTILDASRTWLRTLPTLPTHPPGGAEAAPVARPGSIGTDFFDWCRVAAVQIGDLAQDVAELVRQVIEDGAQDRTDTSTQDRHEPERSVKGLVRRDGQARWFVVRVHRIRDHVTARAVVSVIDITDGMSIQQKLRQATEDAHRLTTALSQEKTLLTGVISAVPQLVFWKDDAGRYVGCNAAYLAFRGLEEHQLLGRTDAGLPDDALAAVLAELEPAVVSSGQPVIDRKTDLTDCHGQVRALLLSVLPLEPETGRDCGRGIIGVGADITHARELEHQLAQANRLESIGQLAAGIAHELNTPIQYVADNTTFVAEATATLLTAVQRIGALAGDGSPATAEIAAVVEPLELDFLAAEIPGALAESKEGLARVTQIVRAMKDYAHPGSGRQEIDVNRAIESTVQVCRNEWKYVAKVELDLEPDGALAPCFEGELKQVVLNMIVNAAQAFEEDPRREADGRLGTITISTRRTADELLITIRDDGPGMDDTVRRRAFDPFFTTKEVGKGSGQGLSLAHSVIVTKHSGRIDLETAPGKGTCFTLHLPLFPGEGSPG